MTAEPRKISWNKWQRSGQVKREKWNRNKHCNAASWTTKAWKLQFPKTRVDKFSNSKSKIQRTKTPEGFKGASPSEGRASRGLEDGFKGASKELEEGLKPSEGEGGFEGLEWGFRGAWRGLRRAWRGLEGGLKGAWRGLEGGLKGAWRGLKPSEGEGCFEGAWRGLEGGLKGASRGLYLRKVLKGLEGGFKEAWSLQRWRGTWRGFEGLHLQKAWGGLDTQWTASVHILHMPKPNVTRVQSATQWTASVHTLHMPKPNVTHVQVLRNGLPRYILYTCPNLM